MPLQRCGNGWKWGEQGKCYESKKDAIKQGLAIEGTEKFKQMASAELDGFDLYTAKVVMAESSKKKNTDFLTEVAKSFDEMNPTKAYIPEHVRDKIPDEDFAGEHRSYPIRNEMDVHHAATLIGHAPDPSKVKKKIIEIAKRKGLELPSSWKD